MKKVLAYIVSLALLLSLVPLAVYAAPSDVTIESDVSNADVDDDVTITVTFPASSGTYHTAYAAGLKFTYNEDAFTVKSFTAPSYNGTAAGGSNAAAGAVSCTYVGNMGENTIDCNTAVEFVAVFTVKDGAAGNYDFVLDTDFTQLKNLDEMDYVTEYDLITFSTTKATVTIGTATCAHTNLSPVAIKAPTCTEEGYEAYWVCEECGALFSGSPATDSNKIDAIVTTAAIGHDWDDGVITTPAGCETDGVKTYTCNNDPGHTSTEAIAATGHNFNTSSVTLEPTEDAEGIRTWYCANDPEHTSTEAIAKKDHDHTAFLVAIPGTPASCTVDGNSAYWTCTKCGAYFGASTATESDVIAADSWVIPAPGHDGIPYAEVPATCETDGVEAYWECATCHALFSDAECTNEIATAAAIPALGHDYDYAAATYEWASDYSFATATAICANDALHTTVAGVVVSGTETTPATCTEEGEMTYTATFGGGFTAQTTKTAITMLPHTPSHHPASPAGCETEGNTEYWTCSVCSKFFSDAACTTEITEADTVQYAAGHNWGTWTVVTPAGVEKGAEQRVCTNDPSHIETRDIPAVGHTHTPVHNDAVAATCCAKGNVEYWTCSECDGLYFSDEDCTTQVNFEDLETAIDPSAHNWDSGVITVPATADTDGVKTYTCQNDNRHTSTEAIAANGGSSSGGSASGRDGSSGSSSDTPATTPVDTTDAAIKASEKFVDVNEDDYFAAAVGWAIENGITEGTSATTFSPNDVTTREQYVTFLWRAAGSPEPAEGDCPFMDLNEGEYYYKAVLWAYQQGITKGVSATEFGTGKEVSRGQAVTFLYRYKGIKEYNLVPFNDVDSGDYFYDAVVWAYDEGVTDGTSPTTFSPDKDCLRCQTVTFLYRALAE